MPKELVHCREMSSLAVSAMQRDDYRRAESLLAKAVETCGHDPDTRRRYAETLWHRGAHQDALKQLNQAIELAGNDAEFLTQRAQWYLALGNVDAARADADSALDAAPHTVGPWLLRARVARHTSQMVEALANYHRVLGMDAAHREALLEKADVHWQLSEADPPSRQAHMHRALATVQALLDTYPQGKEPQEVLFLAGRTFFRLSRFDDSVRSLALAAGRGRPNPDVLYHLAEAQLRAGRPGDALASVRHSLSIAPEHAASRDLFGRMHLATQPRAPDVLR